MDLKEYKEVPYTIYTDFETSTVWLNNFNTKEKIVITEKEAQSIANSFKLIKAKKEGLF